MFARYYDVLMSDIDYEIWYKFLKPYIEPSQTIFDMGAGTGHILELLSKKNYNIVGFDNDPLSIDIALNKSLKINLHDITLPFEHSCDIALLFFDVINYFKDPKPLLTNIFKTLNPNGLIILDFYTKEYLNDINNYHEIETIPFEYEWKVTVDGIIMNHAFKTKSYFHNLTQYCYGEDFYKKILTSLGLKVSKVAGPDERKIYLFARKS